MNGYGLRRGEEIFMALKLAGDDNNNQGSDGLRLSGGNDNGTESVEQQSNPWDFDEPLEPIKISSTREVSPDEGTFSSRNGNPVLKVTKILVYLAVIAEIAGIVWACTSDLKLFANNLMGMRAITSLVGFICIVDAILVNVLYEKKISLIIWAIFFAFLYPLKRNQHVTGNGGFGGMLSGLYIISFVVCIGITFNYVANFGNTYKIRDEATRNTILDFMDQRLDNGERYGKKLMSNYLVEDIGIDTSTGTTVIYVIGDGTVYLDADVFVETSSKTIPTQLGFTKGSDGRYTLAAVILQDTQVNPRSVNYYSENVMLK